MLFRPVFLPQSNLYKTGWRMLCKASESALRIGVTEAFNIQKIVLFVSSQAYVLLCCFSDATIVFTLL